MENTTQTNDHPEDDDSDGGQNGAASNAGPKFHGGKKNRIPEPRRPEAPPLPNRDNLDVFPALNYQDAERLDNGYYLLQRNGQFYLYDEDGRPVSRHSSREQAVDEAYDRKPPSEYRM